MSLSLSFLARGAEHIPCVMILILVTVLVKGCSAYSYSAEHLRRVISERHGGLTLVLENVRKENVALVARTAECLGVGSLHLIYTPDMDVSTRSFGRLSDIAKAATLSKISKSATNLLSISFFSDVEECVAALRAKKYDVLVATTPPSVADGDVVLDLHHETIAGEDWALQRCALLFGSEVNGLSDGLLRCADTRVSIAQRGVTQSLNVATCASIVLAEVTRRRAISGCELRLSDSERQLMETELLPEADTVAVAGAAAGARSRVNKAAIKHEMRKNREALKPDPVYLDAID